MPPTASVAIVLDETDPVAGQPPVRWAAGELRDALAQAGVAVESRPAAGAAAPEVPALTILIAGPGSGAAQGILAAAGARMPASPEALAVVEGAIAGGVAVLACGSDVRGLVYAALELADRVRYRGAADPLAALRGPARVEAPVNPIRSIARLFTSDVEDKAWWYDRGADDGGSGERKGFWTGYLTELATQRYNRFCLTLGLGHNFPRHVPDAYFYFAYPFLVDVPGYHVRASNLPDAERERNLDTLRFVGEETRRRGLHFQLALWTHAYEWIDSPDVNHTIEGLTAETHAAYCRDALRTLLEAVPTIDGLTFRVHGESGIPEGSWDFWRTVFDGAAQVAKATGRPIEIDMHAKGIDQETIDAALHAARASGAGMSVNVSPKYWAEHQGLPYHQASIRELERPPRQPVESRGFMAVSAGSRRHTRYGYTDLLKEDRPYGVFYRIWPGTQRLLLWGDPAMAAGYGHFAHFSGCLGVELCEPLSFKGRIGSGLPGGRDGYADESLKPAGSAADWEKYRYTYRVWGRLTYDPHTDPDGWRRYTRAAFGPAAGAMETALANASRILLLITTAYHPSASNNRYWPEIYTNMPIVDPERPHPYGDTPWPKRFGTVSSLDPELFSSVDECAAEALSGRRSGRYSPLDVAAWLDGFAATAAHSLADARGAAGAEIAACPEFRRWEADIAIESALGRFFAAKLRAGVAYALGTATGDRAALREALAHYRAARTAWAEAVEHGRVYRDDLTFGSEPWLRGHWADRLPAIDQDIADMEERLSASSDAPPRRAPSLADLAADRPAVSLRHTPPASFRRGAALPVDFTLDGAASGAGLTGNLRYRHVNQAETYETAPLERSGATLRATIPAAYTDSPYPLEYFVALRDGEGRAGLYPGFEPDLSNQPYFVVRQETAA